MASVVAEAIIKCKSVASKKSIIKKINISCLKYYMFFLSRGSSIISLIVKSCTN
ncbi:hypothetical protein Hanom_Chr17g01564371 [Helianthus anomalus]